MQKIARGVGILMLLVALPMCGGGNGPNVAPRSTPGSPRTPTPTHTAGPTPTIGSADWVVEATIGIPGIILGIAIDPAGQFAYVSTGSGLVTVDLASRRATKVFPLTNTANTPLIVDVVDPSGEMVLLHNFAGAVVVRAADGVQVQSVPASAAGRAAFANGSVYVPSFNGRALVAAQLSGTQRTTINPYGSAGQLATPTFAVATPDGTKVIFDDSSSASVFVVDTSTNMITAAVPLGFPAAAAFPGNDLNTLFVSPGILELSDLTMPTEVPQVIPVDFLGTPQGPSGGGASFDRTVGVNSAVTRVIDFREVPVDPQQTTFQAELGVIEIDSGTVSRVLDLPSEAFVDSTSMAIIPNQNIVLLGSGARLYFLRAVAPL